MSSFNCFLWLRQGCKLDFCLPQERRGSKSSTLFCSAPPFLRVSLLRRRDGGFRSCAAVMACGAAGSPAATRPGGMKLCWSHKGPLWRPCQGAEPSSYLLAELCPGQFIPPSPTARTGGALTAATSERHKAEEGDGGGGGGRRSLRYHISAGRGRAHKATELITEAIWTPHKRRQSWEQ